MSACRTASGAAAFALLAGAACSVDEQNIQHWKTTQHGPYKIRTALSDGDQPTPMRAAAAVALAEVGLIDEMAGDLAMLSPAEARPVADGAATRLELLLNGSGQGQVATRAKDALFAIRDQLSPAVRRGADAAVIRWIAADLRGRSLLGAHGADRIVSTLGAAAGGALAEQLANPRADVAEIARLIALIDDTAARDRAAEILVTRARKERPARDAVFLGLARLGGPKVAAYLAETVLKGTEDARLFALRALQMAPDASALPAVAQVAADRTLDGERALLRDEAFAALGQILERGDDRARSTLLGFLGDSDDKVRWRAVGAVVESEDARALASLLDALPKECLGSPGELRDYLEAPLQLAGSRVLPTVRAALSAKSPAGRLVAVRVLAQIGEVEDAPRLDGLSRDRARLRGWSGLPTVGAEARAAAARLRERSP